MKTDTQPQLWFRNIGNGMLSPEVIGPDREVIYTFQPVSEFDFIPFTNAFSTQGFNRCFQMDVLAQMIEPTFFQLEGSFRDLPYEQFSQIVSNMIAIAEKAKERAEIRQLELADAG